MMISIMVKIIVLILTWWGIVAAGLTAQPSRTVMTRQGAVRGLRIDHRPSHKELGFVDAFLGIPYAGPPTGPLRDQSSTPFLLHLM